MKDKILKIISDNSVPKHFCEYGEGIFADLNAVNDIADELVKLLTIPVVVKSLPCGDEIWLKAQETDRFLFEEWFDELKQAMFYNDSICAARHEVEYIPCYILARN